MTRRLITLICTFLVVALGGVQGFLAPTAPSSLQSRFVLKAAPPSLPLDQTSPLQSSSVQVSAETLDPTTFLSDLLSGLFGSSAILAIPVVAALSVAGLVVFFIVSYANPAEPDE